MIKPVVYPITLDVYKTGSQKVLSMVRGDNKRVIVIALTENDKPYVITEGCTAKFTALKPDGNFIYNDCEIDIKNNTINYQVTDQTTAVNGIVSCQIRLIGANGGLLSAPSFNMVVSDLLYNEEEIIDSSNEFNALTRLLADIQHKLDNGEFDGKSIYIKGSVADVSELDAKIPTAIAGDGYLADNCHLYVFDGTAFKDMGEVRGPQGVSGVYVGSGDMPDGYNVQIDPNGAAFEMDTELNEESLNPVTNGAIATKIKEIDNAIKEQEDLLKEKTETIDALARRVAENELTLQEVPVNYAPSGFGLGVSIPQIITSIEELDHIVKNGWYRLTIEGTSAKLCNVEVNYSTVFVECYNHNAAHQTIKPINSTVQIKRSRADGIWGEWGIENPPMQDRVEYRTTEMFRGKPVYTILVNIPNLPNADIYYLDTGIIDVIDYVIDISGTAKAGDGDYRNIFQMDEQVNVYMMGSTLVVYTDNDASDYCGYVTIKYTKK